MLTGDNIIIGPVNWLLLPRFVRNVTSCSECFVQGLLLSNPLNGDTA